MYKKFILIIFLLTLSYFSVFGYDNKTDTIINTLSLKDYFTSNEEKYYFGYDGITAFSINNNKIVSKTTKPEKVNNDFYAVSLNKLVYNGDNIVFQKDGSVLISRDNADYSCIDNALNNCLYSDVYITDIHKKSLFGKISLSKIDKSIPIEKDKMVKFADGSVIYSIFVETKPYDFDNFTDFDSLVCSKNEENKCIGVINNKVIDKVALFELNRGNNSLSNILYKDTGAGLFYVYNLESNKLIPYNAKCFTSSSDYEALKQCRDTSYPVGEIRLKKHKTGIMYWEVDYNNELIDNVFIWVNKRGEPFKAFTKSRQAVNFTIFNKISADSVVDKLFFK